MLQRARQRDTRPFVSTAASDAGKQIMAMLQGNERSKGILGDRHEPQPLSTDEFKLWEMEAREDIERGADERNADTFGADCVADGWTFEENLAANERLAGQPWDKNARAAAMWDAPYFRICEQSARQPPGVFHPQHPHQKFNTGNQYFTPPAVQSPIGAGRWRKGRSAAQTVMQTEQKNWDTRSPQSESIHDAAVEIQSGQSKRNKNGASCKNRPCVGSGAPTVFVENLERDRDSTAVDSDDEAAEDLSSSVAGTSNTGDDTPCENGILHTTPTSSQAAAQSISQHFFSDGLSGKDATTGAPVFNLAAPHDEYCEQAQTPDFQHLYFQYLQAYKWALGEQSSYWADVADDRKVGRCNDAEDGATLQTMDMRNGKVFCTGCGNPRAPTHLYCPHCGSDFRLQ